MLKNRQEAGTLLAQKLVAMLCARSNNPVSKVVIGLPRGGVPVAAEIALALSSPLDILVSKKIRCPGKPEFAIGAVSSRGVVVLDDRLLPGVAERQTLIQAQQEQAAALTMDTVEQEKEWLSRAGISERPVWKDKIVILVDDGIATGMTTMAAIKSVQKEHPVQIVLATPVIPEETYRLLSKECNAIVALHVERFFESVGQFYLDFHQLEDDEMIDSLKRGHNKSN